MEADPIKNGVDTKMKAELNLFTDVHQLSTDAFKDQSLVVVLTGDKDFSAETKRLGIQGFNVVAIHNGKTNTAFLDTMVGHSGTWPGLVDECLAPRLPTSAPTAAVAATASTPVTTMIVNATGSGDGGGVGTGSVGGGAGTGIPPGGGIPPTLAPPGPQPLASVAVNPPTAEFLKRYGKADSELLDVDDAALSTSGLTVVLTDYPYKLQVILADSEGGGVEPRSAAQLAALTAALQPRLEAYIRDIVVEAMTVQGVCSVDLKADERLRGLGRAHNVFPFVPRGNVTPSQAAIVATTVTTAVAAAGAKLKMTVPVAWDEATTKAFLASTFPLVKVFRVKVTPPAAPTHIFTSASITLDTRVTATQLQAARAALLAYHGNAPGFPKASSESYYRRSRKCHWQWHSQLSRYTKLRDLPVSPSP